MAHLPPQNLPAFQPFSQSKTLYTVAPGHDAILVELRSGRRRSRPMRFKDAHAALDWSIAHGAGFVHLPAVGGDPSKN